MILRSNLHNLQNYITIYMKHIFVNYIHCINPKNDGEAKLRPYPICLFTPIVQSRTWPVNISKLKYVHDGHFGTLQRSLGRTVQI